MSSMQSRKKAVEGKKPPPLYQEHVSEGRKDAEGQETSEIMMWTRLIGTAVEDMGLIGTTLSERLTFVCSSGITAEAESKAERPTRSPLGVELKAIAFAIETNNASMSELLDRLVL